jgi:hypothetical protein
MLIGNHVVLILWVNRLVMRRDIDVIVGDSIATKVLKEVCEAA